MLVLRTRGLGLGLEPHQMIGSLSGGGGGQAIIKDQRGGGGGPKSI